MKRVEKMKEEWLISETRERIKYNGYNQSKYFKATFVCVYLLNNSMQIWH